MAREKFHIQGNLSERQIEFDVAQYLGWCSAGLPFRLLSVDEQLTGADAAANVVMPIYMRFKKSKGLPPLTVILKPSSAALSSFESIRRYRKAEDLGDNPTLYFQLRKKAKNASDLQHNILLDQHNPPYSYAIYVAPLELDKERYNAQLFSGPDNLNDPFYWRGVDVRNARLSYHFERQPFLRNHISITPHEKVSDENHYYAYAQTGDDISWHSPEIVSRRPQPLSYFLGARVREFLSNDGEALAPASVWKQTSRALTQLSGPVEQQLNPDGNPLLALKRYGEWLRDEHEISQFLLIGER